MALKIDLHVHTVYSHDAAITRQDLVAQARKKELDGVAITDHNTTDALREFSKIKDLLIIPGIEVSTQQGHVLAINVNTRVPPDLSFAETIDQIHEAGGLAIVAHPTAFLKGIPAKQIDRNFDAIEVINASAIPFAYSVRKNRKIADELNLPQTGGSDAHWASEIGMAYTLVNASIDTDAVAEAIRKGAVQPSGRAIPWSMRARRGFGNVKKKLIGRF